jgi:hypothetical protein
MVTEIRRKKGHAQVNRARKSRRWVETATALTHYSRGDLFRDCHEDTELRLTNAEARQHLSGNEEKARVRRFAEPAGAEPVARVALYSHPMHVG